MRYQDIEAINWSTLKYIETSPLLLRFRTDCPRPDTAAFRLGRALHCLVLEPAKFKRLYRQELAFGDLRNKANKQAKQDWLDSLPPDITLLSSNDYHQVLAAGDAVRRHKTATKLLTGGRAEEIVTWVDAATGLPCKMRADFIAPTYLVDLKSTSADTKDRFARDAGAYMYHGQMAWYHDGAIAAGVLPKDAHNPYIIAVQMAEPHDVIPFRVSDRSLEMGRRAYRSMLDRYAECRDADWWPGMAPDVVDLDVPPWAAGGEYAEATEAW